MMSGSQTRFAFLTLALLSAFSFATLAQTTTEGPGPSEQPSAPMEVGQDQSGPQSGPGDALDNDTQNDDVQNDLENDLESNNADQDQSGQGQIQEAQPGGPSGEEPAKSDLGVARVSLMHGDV